MVLNNKPKVSVVMPAYNAEKYISTAIESILNQTFKEFEFIIIDDGSTDSTWEVISRYANKDGRVVPVKNERNLKICKSLTKGIDKARADLIARMDADDWAYPERLKYQVEFMERNPEVVILGNAIEVCDKNINPINTRKYVQTDKKIRKRILKNSPFAHPTVMYRKSAVLEAGGYDSGLADIEDYDLYFRLGKLGRFANLDETLLKLRTHSASVSNRKINKQAWGTLKIKLKAIFSYGYMPSISDIIYLVFHLLGNMLIPAKAKFKFLNVLRSIYK